MLCGSTLPLLWHHTHFLITWCDHCVSLPRLPAAARTHHRCLTRVYPGITTHVVLTMAAVHKWNLWWQLSCKEYAGAAISPVPIKERMCGLGLIVCTRSTALSHFNLIKTSSWQWRQRAAETAPWKPRQAAELLQVSIQVTYPRDISHSGPMTHKFRDSVNPFCPMPVSAVCVLTPLRVISELSERHPHS